VLAEDDLRDEAPLATFDGGATPAVRAAELEAKSQDANVAQQRSALFPSLAAQAQERFTNATGFANKNAIFTATLNATWRFDVGVLAQVDAQRAAAGVSAVRKSRSDQTQADDVYAAWMLVRAQLAACRAARSEAQSNRLAATLAKEKYAAGTALQLDVLQADRQAFQSEVTKLEADSDLKYARAALRIAAGRSLAAARAGGAP
jgi:outer membrane protein TolC